MSDDRDAESRAAIGAAITEHVGAVFAQVEDDEEAPDHVVLTGWALVCEWMDGKGERWLTKIAGGGGPATIPSWQAKSYHHEALYGDW